MYATALRLAAAKQRIVIALEGNIAVGKTTFAKALKAKFPDAVEIIEEPIDLWQNCGGFNMLEEFYKDPVKYAYMFQSFAVATRIGALSAALATTTKPIVIIERSCYSDELFVRLCVKNNYMNAVEYQAYKAWREHLWKGMNEHIDGLVYLRCSAKTCLERLVARNRHEEVSVTLDYLESLHLLHEEWLMTGQIDSLVGKPVYRVQQEIEEDFELNVNEFFIPVQMFAEAKLERKKKNNHYRVANQLEYVQ